MRRVDIELAHRPQRSSHELLSDARRRMGGPGSGSLANVEEDAAPVASMRGRRPSLLSSHGVMLTAKSFSTDVKTFSDRIRLPNEAALAIAALVKSEAPALDIRIADQDKRLRGKLHSALAKDCLNALVNRFETQSSTYIQPNSAAARLPRDEIANVLGYDYTPTSTNGSLSTGQIMALGHLRIAAQRAFDDMCEWKAQGDDRYVTSDTAGAYLHRSGVEARMRKNSELQHRREQFHRQRANNGSEPAAVTTAEAARRLSQTTKAAAEARMAAANKRRDPWGDVVENTGGDSTDVNAALPATPGSIKRGRSKLSREQSAKSGEVVRQWRAASRGGENSKVNDGLVAEMYRYCPRYV